MHAGNIFMAQYASLLRPGILRLLDPVARRQRTKAAHPALAAQSSGIRRERSPSPFPSSAIVKL